MQAQRPMECLLEIIIIIIPTHAVTGWGGKNKRTIAMARNEIREYKILALLGHD